MSGASDPILAVSSPPGRSVRGLIRITGDGLGPLVESLFDREIEPRRFTLARLRFDEPEGGAEVSGVEDGRLLGAAASAVPCLVMRFPAGRSFTGQEVLEIQVPGSPALLDRLVRHLLGVMRRALGSGRLAEAGEFTRRAFTAGRIDLTRAEGIAATIGAVSDAQLEAARLLRGGRLGRWAEGLVDRLGEALALVEAGIDFVDQEDVVPIGPDDLHERLRGIEGELAAMVERSRPWSQLEALPWVVMVGPPNAGKSTLLNALLGRERAVTSAVAGTTRDVLSEPLRVETERGAAEVMLVDVAGLDEPAGALDRVMQEQARGAMERAELILLLGSGDTGRPAIEDAAGGEPAGRGAPRLRLHTKADVHPAPAGVDLAVSAVTGEGLAELRGRIVEAVGERAVSLAGQMMALQPRHRAELEGAWERIAEAGRMVEPQRWGHQLEGGELIAERMREGLDRLAAVGGELTPDDVIGKVFATFCVGK